MGAPQRGLFRIRKGIERVRPLTHVHRPRAAGFDDEHGRALGDRVAGPGQVGLGSPADLEQYLAGAGLPAGGNEENADGADEGLVPSHRPRLPLTTPNCASTHYRPGQSQKDYAATGIAARGTRSPRARPGPGACPEPWGGMPGPKNTPGSGIGRRAAAFKTIAGVFVSPGPQSPPSRNTVRLEPRRATRRGGDRTPAPRVSRPRTSPLAGACARNLLVIRLTPAVCSVPSLMSCTCANSARGGPSSAWSPRRFRRR